MVSGLVSQRWPLLCAVACLVAASALPTTSVAEVQNLGIERPLPQWTRETIAATMSRLRAAGFHVPTSTSTRRDAGTLQKLQTHQGLDVPMGAPLAVPTSTLQDAPIQARMIPTDIADLLPSPAALPAESASLFLRGNELATNQVDTIPDADSVLDAVRSICTQATA